MPAGAPAAAPAVVPAPAGGPTVAYSPVYYPGTTVAADASVLTLGPNEERAGVDFSLQLVPTAQIKGRVVDPDGRPQAGLSVSLRPARPDGLDLFSSLLNGTGRTNPDGTFTIQGVKPGSYTLSARATPRAPGADSARRTCQRRSVSRRSRRSPAAATGFTHWAVGGRRRSGPRRHGRHARAAAGHVASPEDRLRSDHENAADRFDEDRAEPHARRPREMA